MDHTWDSQPPGIPPLAKTTATVRLRSQRGDFQKQIEFAIVGANVRIDNFTLRATELSYPAVTAEISKFLQAWNTDGNIQLTYNDTAAFDYGMEMAKETFHANGTTP